MWNGPDDPDNPKNWTMKKKWAATVIVSCFTFISPVSSSMVAPALTSIASELHITREVELQLTLSIFVLAYAIGPLFLGPLSEIYGRVIVLQLANLMYLVFNIACGVSQTKGQMITFRFLAGLGGSAPLAVSAFLHVSLLIIRRVVICRQRPQQLTCALRSVAASSGTASSRSSEGNPWPSTLSHLY